MNAWLEYFAKVAVWKAAIGDNGELLKLLRSNVEIPNAAREQLALLIEGKLVVPKQRRGRPMSEAGPGTVLASHMFSNLGNALSEYRDEADRLRRQGTLYGQSDELVNSIAEKWNVTADALRNSLRTGHRVPKMQFLYGEETSDFRRWLGANKLFERQLRKKFPE